MLTAPMELRINLADNFRLKPYVFPDQYRPLKWDGNELRALMYLISCFHCRLASANGQLKELVEASAKVVVVEKRLPSCNAVLIAGINLYLVPIILITINLY